MKKVVKVSGNAHGHWVGDGFPVRTLFWYGDEPEAVSPFLLLDLAGPYKFEPTVRARGVGPHPHRGIETVTIVYEGEVAHRDSTGHGGLIGPGDVQWMTAAGGILHDEFHSPAFATSGGVFHMVQLWVNLPAADKMHAPGYQTLLANDIPVAALPDEAGTIRVIAGEAMGVRGPARTFSPVNVWDVRLTAGAFATIDLPEGHTAMVVAISKDIEVGGKPVAEGQMATLAREGSGIMLRSHQPSAVLVLTGAPIDEPIAGQGPFVMNSDRELRQAFADLRAGAFGRLEAA